ncbi:iron-sulfur cluster carrier protein ApbC [Polycyclovorans algicola]|uniref:iron-sulfur cluster carrier protein ApbC n=1 Tax=Polycyclovorans algicola TaxID=616992 RepID=UPI001F455755|nr:iron-sulfur cluster carrier protein ApbC [Polycyclovorans algicola]
MSHNAAPFFAGAVMQDCSPEVLAALDDYQHPLIGQGLVSAGVVGGCVADGTGWRLQLNLPIPARSLAATLQADLPKVLATVLEGPITVDVSSVIGTATLGGALKAYPGIRNIIAVASGKGGVGKSTVSANLALALHAEGARVGLLDADIYGPSQPRMMGADATKPSSPDGKTMLPVMAHGVQTMSIGYLIDASQAMIWRGPMVSQALTQLITETRWDDLDYLVIDLPPGTGDIQLTLSQKIPVSGAVIVTTPQDIALLDARKALAMFNKVSVPVLGVVENMSTHVCSNCGHEEAIFGSGGGQRMANDAGIALLGSLPLDLSIRLNADGGHPTVVAEPDGALARRYRDIAISAAAKLAFGAAGSFPTLEITDD